MAKRVGEAASSTTACRGRSCETGSAGSIDRTMSRTGAASAIGSPALLIARVIWDTAKPVEAWNCAGGRDQVSLVPAAMPLQWPSPTTPTTLLHGGLAAPPARLRRP